MSNITYFAPSTNDGFMINKSTKEEIGIDKIIEKIQINAPQKMEYGGKVSTMKSARFTYEGNTFGFTIKNLISPFGASDYEGKYSILGELKLKDGNIEQKNLYVFLNALDEHIKAHIKKNADDYLDLKKLAKSIKKKKASADDISADVEKTYTSSVKEPNDEKYNPLFRIKLPKNDEGNFITPCFVKEEGKLKKVTLEDHHLPRKVVFSSALSFSYIWLTNVGYGISTRCQQIKVVEIPNENECVLSDSSDDEGEDAQETQNVETHQSEDELSD